MKGLRIHEKRLLRQLLDTTDPWQIAGHARLDFPRFVGTVKGLERKGLLTLGRGSLALTSQGRTAVRASGLRSARSLAARVSRAKREFARIAKQRPSSIGIYDQGYMTLDSLFRRVDLIATMGDADLKRIAILGDDDLLSIALCLAARPEKVSVFEIDQRIVDFILKTASEREFPIEAECYDLKKPLPSRLKGTFDTFVSDPSETMAGLKMFLGRGLYLLAAGEARAGYFGLTMIEASARKWSRIQKWLLNGYSVALTHILPRNAYYFNWPDLLRQTAGFSLKCLDKRPEKSWFNSSLIRIETVKGYRPKQMGRITGSIFHDSEASGKPVKGQR